MFHLKELLQIMTNMSLNTLEKFLKAFDLHYTT